MQAYLLDINGLVALFDPAHLHQEAAHKWFSRRGKIPWATCPLTVNGCFRMLCRLAAEPGRVSFFAQPELTDEECFDLTKLSGHHQCTDRSCLPADLGSQYSLACRAQGRSE